MAWHGTIRLAPLHHGSRTASPSVDVPMHACSGWQHTFTHSMQKNSKERTLRKIKPCLSVYMCPSKTSGHMPALVPESILNSSVKVQYPIIMLLHLRHLSMLLSRRFYNLRVSFFNFSLILCILLDFNILYVTLFVRIYSALCIWRLFDALGIFFGIFYIFRTFLYYFMYLLYIFWIN